jgi:hypothetical protein
MIVGTSPPQTVLTNPAYIEVVRRWYQEINEGREAVHPLLDWNEATIASQNVRSLTEQFQSDDDFLPPFINHHPGLVSETYSDQFTRKNDHPLSLQLQEMLIELTSMWHTPESRPSEERSSYNKIYEFATIITYNMDSHLLSYQESTRIC